MSENNNKEELINYIQNQIIEFINLNYNFRYYLDFDASVFMDPRISVRDILMLLVHMCDKFKIPISNLESFKEDVTINAIATKIYYKIVGLNYD